MNYHNHQRRSQQTKSMLALYIWHDIISLVPMNQYVFLLIHCSSKYAVNDCRSNSSHFYIINKKITIIASYTLNTVPASSSSTFVGMQHHSSKCARMLCHWTPHHNVHRVHHDARECRWNQHISLQHISSWPTSSLHHTLTYCLWRGQTDFAALTIGSAASLITKLGESS